MWRRRLLSGSVFFCALGAVAVMAASAGGTSGGGGDPVGVKSQVAEAGNGMVKQIYDDQDAFRRKPPYSGGNPWGRNDDVKEFRITPGRCYTSIMIVPSRTSGSQRLRMASERSEFPITVQGGETFILPFPKGWRPDCITTISGDLCEGDFEVWGIAEDGPVSFACSRH